MAGGDPALLTTQDELEDGVEADQLHGSYQDRSVTEIETSFSEHFVPTLEDDDEDDTPRLDAEELSSSEFTHQSTRPMQDTAGKIRSTFMI